MRLLVVLALVQFALVLSEGASNKKERIVFNLSSQRSANAFPTHHHVKWVTNQTRFPIKMSANMPSSNVSDVFELAWERSTDKKLIHTLPDLNKNYAITKEDAKSTLLVLNYNNETNEQLGSYEPRLIVNGNLVDRNQTASILKERNVYTLARLTQHKISVKKLMNKNMISCIADFLVSNSEQESVESIMMLMEKYASFKLAIQSKAKVRNSNKNRPQLINPAVFPQQPQQQPLPQVQNVQPTPIQVNVPQMPPQHQIPVQQVPVQQVAAPQPVFQNVPQPQVQQIQNVPDLNQIHQQQLLQQQQILAQQQLQQQLMQQQIQQQQHNWNINIPQQHYNSNPYYNQYPYMQMPHQQVPYQSYPGLIDESYLMYNNNNQQPEQAESTDSSNSGESSSSPADSFAESTEQRQQRLLQNVYFTQHSQRYKQFFPDSHAANAQASFMSQDNWNNYKRKRSVNGDDSEESSIVEQQSADVDDIDYDESRFVKIRLTLGPVTLFRPILTDEVVSCSLDLINIADSQLDYKSTVYMKLPEWMDPIEQRRVQEALATGIVHPNLPMFKPPPPVFRPVETLPQNVQAPSHSDALKVDQNANSDALRNRVLSSSSPMLNINPLIVTLATLSASILVHLL